MRFCVALRTDLHRCLTRMNIGIRDHESTESTRIVSRNLILPTMQGEFSEKN